MLKTQSFINRETSIVCCFSDMIKYVYSKDLKTAYMLSSEMVEECIYTYRSKSK